MDPDLALLERWRAGDLSAGGDLFRRHMPDVLRFFEHKAGTKAEDLTQQTFLDCVKALHQFRGHSSFRTYLFAIARNALFRYLRRESNREAIDFEGTSIAELGAAMTSPSSRLERARQGQRLHTALALLPVEQQLLLEYHYWYELDAAALGEIFQVPAGTIRVRLLRARNALRKRLEEAAPGDSAPDDPITRSLIASKPEDEAADRIER